MTWFGFEAEPTVWERKPFIGTGWCWMRSNRFLAIMAS
jgi:hypothetical protein